MQSAYTLEANGRVHRFDMATLPWQATANPGLWLKPVRMDEGKGLFLGLVRFDAFARSGLHQHLGVATSLVVQGGLTDYHGPIHLPQTAFYAVKFELQRRSDAHDSEMKREKGVS